VICANCKRRLRQDATSCVCGKFEGQSQIMRPVIACCFQGCADGAICRLWTKTGWANVCRTHYGKVETVPRKVESVVTLEIREAYEKSAHFRRQHGGEAVPGTIGAALPREPGSDDDLPLGISRDPLEQEFLDRTQP